MEIASLEFGLSAALRVKSAKFWLMLGQPGQALRELESLPAATLHHPWVARVFLSAIGSARDLNEYPAQI